MTKSDYIRAVKTYKGSAKNPSSIEVKNRGENKWRIYRFSDENKINWNNVDAARVNFVEVGQHTTVIRVYPR